MRQRLIADEIRITNILHCILFLLVPVIDDAQSAIPPDRGISITENIGTKRQLFLDAFLIDSINGAELKLQSAQVAEISIDFREKGWEGAWAGQGPTILKDGFLYRMYYFAPMTLQRVGPETNGSTAYAESTDGIHWKRIQLHQLAFNGSTDNNLIRLPKNIHPFHLIRPFIDTKPGVPPSEKYKAIAGAALFQGVDSANYTDGLYVLVSGDGVHWKKFSTSPFLPSRRFSSADGKSNFPNPVDYDGMNTLFWSDAEQQYVCLYRGWIKSLTLRSPDDSYGGTGWYRWVKKTTSRDLITWTAPVPMDTGGLRPEQWYMHATTPYFRASQYFVGIPSHYITYPSPDFPDSIHSGHVARCESRFTFSRAGTTAYNRGFADKRFVETGLPADPDYFFPDLTSWPVFAGRMGINIVPTSEKEISCYLEQPGRIVRYKLRTDGFTAVSAQDSGTLVTNIFKFSGDRLALNYAATQDGYVQIELQDSAGRPLKGYSISNSDLLTGDEISKQVSWKKRWNLSRLAGKSVRIKFILYRAKLFSFKFS